MPSVIAVFGATGKQGGAVARSLLLNKSAFHVRAITRNPNSEASRRLAEAGADVVQADGFDRQQMRRAFDGCWGCFVNLNSDDPLFRQPGAPSEVDLGKGIVDAAVDAGVEHLVFSSGPPCVEMTGGKVNMKAMESTGKKTRFAPLLPDWNAFDTHGIPELDDVKLMFAFTQTTDGLYFGPETSQTVTAAELKRATSEALSRPAADAGLVSPREWFAKHFGP
ncbi:hypothetical protein L249_8934 [Ophiocordyceps polyrhachis-furcata BCC 54312]|uniref:NmrA-like domain-containing protein n=1 Tax=Ophiocordyceps polyrhachis-furcata BCC 54312 TaxID=1330021 RepID=A0A367L214_9HYPO|nr:hypothetical protein L249_8934 [Ophiocordyceps polyrhachis-furcata BCC 54312]